MYLKTIKMQGFKSFAKQTIINFDEKITGIVGPNGSGKSNIVDAIRWVLGEQSIKSLRGDYGMTDVIFSGSENIKAANIASVTLIFDNSAKTIPVDYTEISIGRKLYYDGTNEYYLNNQACRLMDITNFLLENGIVKDSFNIISQGKIDEIIDAKPLDRKVIFEEAAGVLKYKKKKEETIRKLDRTNENMARVDDIIFEIEQQRKPLLREKKKSEKYQKYQSELAQQEIALLANEIKDLTQEYDDNKANLQKLQEELQKLENSSFLGEDQLQDKKAQISTLAKEIVTLQQKLLEQTTLVEKLNSEKKILLERKNYQVDDQKKHQNIVNLKENKGELENYLQQLTEQIDNFKNDLNKAKENEKAYIKQLEKLENERNQTQIELSKFLREEQSLKTQISQAKESLDNNSYMPAAVTQVLQQPHLKTYGTVGQNLEIAPEYNTAIAVALGNLVNNVIVDNETDAKAAINYLKNNNLGRVTFQPLQNLKAKKIDSSILEKVTGLTGFIDMATELVKYDDKYQVVVNNMLGNVLVVDNLDNANKIAAATYYRHKIVTLDGELINHGGAITGGVHRLSSTITIKRDLEKNLFNLNKTEQKISDLENQLNEIDANFQTTEKAKWQVKQTIMHLETKLEQITNEQQQTEEKINNLAHDINKLADKNYFDEEENQIMQRFYEAKKQKTQIENQIAQKQKAKDELEALVTENEGEFKKQQKLYLEKQENMKNVEIQINRLDVQLENKINYLNETYKITYEYASNHYTLEDEITVVQAQVADLKEKIRKLGNVNPNAIADFNQLDERYNFFQKQKQDLQASADNLAAVMRELDQVMKKEFLNNFKQVQKNFQRVFATLFAGGQAQLSLTNPDDVLNSGVEIKAQPPGKNLASIKLLSGGEKSLTAISLLFAILETKKITFCVFDEIEASLDETNVATFGQYIEKLKPRTQFIIITHKKKTMEYVDLLYGMTMQEPGTSKLVSVRLSDLN